MCPTPGPRNLEPALHNWRGAPVQHSSREACAATKTQNSRKKIILIKIYKQIKTKAHKHTINFWKQKSKEKLLKATKEKHSPPGTSMRMTADFAPWTMASRGKWHSAYFLVFKEPWWTVTSLTSETVLREKEVVKTFPEEKLEDFVTSKFIISSFLLNQINVMVFKRRMCFDSLLWKV